MGPLEEEKIDEFDLEKIKRELEDDMIESPLFEGEIPVYYNHDKEVIGAVSAIKKPNGTVVMTIRMPEENGMKIIEMLEANVRLMALGFVVTGAWPKAK